MKAGFVCSPIFAKTNIARRFGRGTIFVLLVMFLLVGAWPVSAVWAAATEWEAPYVQAMGLAKQERYEQALTALAQLQTKYPTVAQILFDYAVVLHWGGRDKAATALYESRISRRRDVPAYVQEAIANAYFRQQQYAPARILYQALATSDERRSRRARLMEAEVLILQNDPAAAQQIYEAMLKEQPDDLEVYLARGRARLGNGDSRRASEDFLIAQAVAKKQKDAAKQKQIDALLATALLRAGDLEQAVLVLHPYIRSGQADASMQIDYITGLSFGGKADRAVAEAREFWPDLLTAPVPAVRTLGDAYMVVAKYDAAIVVYDIVLRRDPKNQLAMLGMAAARVQKGQLNEAVQLYERALALNLQLANIVLDDCLQYMVQGKAAVAQRVFALIKTRIPIQSNFFRQYAERLKQTESPNEALKNLRLLQGQP